MLVVAIILFIICIWLYYLKEQDRKAQLEDALPSNQQMVEEKERIDKLFSAIEEAMESVPGIVCWGDSLTAGAGGDGTTYPAVLQELIQKNILDTVDFSQVVNPKYNNVLAQESYTVQSIEVVNMGVGGENTITIMGRNGALPFVVKEAFVIPPSKEPTEITLLSQNGQMEAGVMNQRYS